MAKKSNRRESMMAVEGLKELFCEVLLPSDRKLLAFEGQKATGSVSKPQILQWYFEDAVKKAYLEFLRVLEGHLADDPVAFNRGKALGIAWELLVQAPEQEASLLALILNKLGDSDNKIASKASYLMLLTSQQHPNMLLVLVRESKGVVLKATASMRTIYYGLVWLNQIVLCKEQQAVANSLVELYFELFKVLQQHQQKKGKKDSDFIQKCITALLTGLNRAFPWTALEPSRLAVHTETLFQMVHSSNFNSSIQALNLLLGISRASEGAENSLFSRLARTVYQLLSDAELVASTSKQPLLLNFLFKLLLLDKSDERVCAFFKRMIQICAFQQPPFICATLALVSECIDKKPWFKEMKQKKELMHYSKSTSTQTNSEAPKGYDSKKRDPLYAEAFAAPLANDLALLQQHFHPTVARYAQQLATDSTVECRGVDPFTSFSSAAFLDKFSYKNPKALTEAAGRQRGISAMQPIKLGVQVLEPVNQRLSSCLTVAPEDEKFFQKFFTSTKATRKRLEKERENKKESPNTEADEDEFDNLEIEDAELEAPDSEGDDNLEDDDEDNEDLEEDDLDNDLDDENLDSDQQNLDSDNNDQDNFDFSTQLDLAPPKKKKKNTVLYADAMDYLSD